MMNAREKFLASMAFEPGAPILKWEYGYWGGAVRRWQSEGLVLHCSLPEEIGYGSAVRAEGMGLKPGGYVDVDIHDRFGFDDGFQRVPLNNYMCPAFEEVILEDHDSWVLKLSPYGVKVRAKKDHSSLDSFAEGPVKTREDWEKIKAERLLPNLERRLPANWNEQLASYKDRTFPLILGGGQGFYGTPRYLFGDEQLFTVFYDNPQLILDINDHLCNLWMTIYDEVLKVTTVDLALVWEDMCYRNGPLISPAMFDKFLLPFYKRLTGFFRDHGVKIVFVDTDGDFRKLIPNFLAGGVTGFFPVEAAAGADVVEIRKAYPRLQLLGGIDKRALPQGEQAIAAELQKHVLPILDQGGFIPTIDHLVPPDVSWQQFVLYRSELNAYIDRYSASAAK
ncbi:MAG TPA: uroporphyrinogen decarboxylase family protein [Longilinea sp.]|nr:uroporphyrinogen decarboxylase family protein [Longilinea sp.]